VGVPKKPTGFFWVRTRVSEPCSFVLFFFCQLLETFLSENLVLTSSKCTPCSFAAYATLKTCSWLVDWNCAAVCDCHLHSQHFVQFHSCVLMYLCPHGAALSLWIFIRQVWRFSLQFVLSQIVPSLQTVFLVMPSEAWNSFCMYISGALSAVPHHFPGGAVVRYFCADCRTVLYLYWYHRDKSCAIHCCGAVRLWVVYVMLLAQCNDSGWGTL